MQRRLGAVHVLDKSPHPSGKGEVLLLSRALVDQRDFYAIVEKRQFAQPFGENIVVILHVIERRLAGEKVHLGAAFFSLAGFPERRYRHTVAKLDLIAFAVAPNGKPQPFRERVDDRDTDAMQTAGNLVGVVVELAAGVQLGHHDFRRRALLLVVGLDFSRYAAPVILHADRIVGVYGYRDVVAVSRQRLVYRVVDDFEDHVMQAGAVAGIADIHAGPLAYGFKTLEDFYAIGIVVIAARRWFRVCHMGRLCIVCRAFKSASASRRSENPRLRLSLSARCCWRRRKSRSLSRWQDWRGHRAGR